MDKGLHPHYHLCIAINRINIAGGSMPQYLKLDNAWHCGAGSTKVEFVKKNVRHYLSKYFAKNYFRPLNLRSYGNSHKYAAPQTWKPTQQAN